MTAVLAVFYQEKALVASRGLLRDYEPSDHLRMELFEALENMQKMRIKFSEIPLALCREQAGVVRGRGRGGGGAGRGLLGRGVGVL